MVPSDEYIDIKRDLDRVRKLFTRLSLMKEQEVVMRRMGKRLPASEIREMREMEESIQKALSRRTMITSFQQRNLFETFKYQFHSSMRAWKNRLAFAEHLRERKKRNAIVSET
jgi:hypothetical protein